MSNATLHGRVVLLVSTTATFVVSLAGWALGREDGILWSDAVACWFVASALLGVAVGILDRAGTTTSRVLGAMEVGWFLMAVYLTIAWVNYI